MRTNPVLEKMYTGSKKKEDDTIVWCIKTKDQLIEDVKEHDLNRITKKVKGEIYACFKEGDTLILAYKC